MASATDTRPVRLSQPNALSTGVEVDRNAGVIRNVSIITAGPAIGHGFTVDDVMLSQVFESARQASKGVKSHLTHAALGLFGGGTDPIEKLVGRVRNPRLEGDRVRGDVHLAKYAASSPAGDLRTYLMDVAEEDPEAIGLSIVFEPAEYKDSTDADGNPVLLGRITKVLGVDFVGDPGANPTGLLSQGDNAMAAKKTKALQDGELPVVPAETPDVTPIAEEDEQTFVDRFVADPAMQDKYPDGEERIGKAKGIYAAATAEPAPTEPAPEPEPVVEPAPAMNAQRIKTEALAADGRRRTGIMALATKHGQPPTWAQGLCDRGVSLAQATELVELAKMQAPVAIRVGVDQNLATIGPAISDAISLRAGCKLAEPHERAQKFRGLSVLDMYRQWLSSHGVPDAAYLSRVRLAELMGERALRRAYPSVALAMSSSDFTHLLLDASTKTLMQAYLDAPKTWNIWARQETAPDFKNINRVAISEVPDLIARTEANEVQFVTLSDSKETYALVEYASQIRVTRKAMINDDLSAFGRIPQLQGAACARKEDDVAYAILTANAALADGVALFHATHANLIAAGGAAPSVITLAATEKLLTKQKGPKSKARLELKAQYILVPTSIHRVTQQVIKSLVDPAATNQTYNPFAHEGLQIVPSARLDDSSATVWYLLANSSTIDTIEVCFLADEQTPVLAEEDDWDTDDHKWKVRHTVAAKAIDFRGMAKNPGV